jgi:hypothetical protein
MNTDQSFYRTSDIYRCPRCLGLLAWHNRPGIKDSMMLVHPDDDLHNSCPNAEKWFYAPVTSLTEIPKGE